MTAHRNDSAPALERDVTCVCCGYNLRGLRLDGRCPECGAPVAQELRFADRHWLQRMAASSRRLQVGLAVGVGACPLGAIGLVFFLTAFYFPASAGVFVPLGVLSAGLLLYVTPRVLMPATFAVTAPEPRPPHPARRWSWGRRLRVVSVGTFVVGAIAFVWLMATFAFADPQRTVANWPLPLVLLALSSLVLPYLLYALFAHLRPLAHRAGEAPLLASTRNCQKVVLLLPGLPVAILTAGLLFDIGDPRLVLASSICCVWPLALLVMLWIGVGLVSHYRRMFETLISEGEDRGEGQDDGA